MNRRDSVAYRQNASGPLARAAASRPPLVEYPGGWGRQEELGELRYMPVKQEREVVKKRRFSRGMLAYFVVAGCLVLGLTVFYLMREEHVASASAACTQLEREISALQVNYEAKRTQFECSTDIENVRIIASERLNMGYGTADQLSLIEYSQHVLQEPLSSVVLNMAIGADEDDFSSLEGEGIVEDTAMPGTVLDEATNTELDSLEETAVVIPVESPEEAGYGAADVTNHGGAALEQENEAYG